MTEAPPTSQRLEHLARQAAEEGVAGADCAPVVTLEWIMGQMHERAFGLFLLVLALPCAIPFLYGVPQVVALPLMFVSAQLLLGRTAPWLPEKLAAREVSQSSLEALAQRAGPWLRRLEAISRPRLLALTRRPADRLVGAALVVFSASILLPLPLTNTVPGVAVIVAAMGLLQRDGALVLLGAAIGMSWIASLIFAGAALTTVLRGWLGI